MELDPSFIKFSDFCFTFKVKNIEISNQGAFITISILNLITLKPIVYFEGFKEIWINIKFRAYNKRFLNLDGEEYKTLYIKIKELENTLSDEEKLYLEI